MINKIYLVALVANKKDEPTFRVVSAANDNEELTIKDISLTTGFGVYKANEFMRGLNTGIDVKFENFKQYDRLIKDVNKKISSL